MSEYVIDTSNSHPKIKPESQKEEFLVQYNLLVDNQVYNIHGLIWAKDSIDAMRKMPDGVQSTNYSLVKECVIGAVKDQERRKIHDALHNIGGGIILP